MDLHVRGVPDEVHQTLTKRAAAHDMSLRAYVVRLLQDSCALPTVDEWLAQLDDLPPAAEGMSGASAVNAEREERDAQLADGDRRR